MSTAAVYLRKSTLDKKGVFEQHRARMDELAKQLGAEIPDSLVFIDDDTSATKKRGAKTAWAGLIKKLPEAKPDYLLAFANDRLGRRFTDLETLDDVGKKIGLDVRVWTWHRGSENFFDSPDWPILVGRAKSEALYTSVRVKEAQILRRERGLQSGGGKRPYGYEDDRRTIRESEAKVIREIAARMIAGEASNAITNDLNRRGVPTTDGAKWRNAHMRRMMAKGRYAGLLEHKGQVIGKAAWPGILERETWEAVQQALKTTAKPDRGRPTSTLLGGILHCGVCGGPMYGATWGDSKQTPSYHCDNADCGGGKDKRKPYRAKPYRARATVDKYVVDQVLPLITAQAVATDVAVITDQIEACYDKDFSLWLEIGMYETALEKRDPRYEIEDLLTTLKRLRQDKQDNDKRWAELVRQKKVLERATQARSRWNRWTTDEKRAFIRSHIKAIFIHPNGKRGVARPLEDGEIEIIPRSEVPGQ